MEQGIESVLAVVSGTVYRSDEGDAVIILDHEPYAIRVDSDGNTSHAHLVTVSPGFIARAMNLTTGDVGGWATGWDA